MTRIDRIGLDVGTPNLARSQAAAAAAAGARMVRVRLALDGRSEPDAAFLSAARAALDAVGAAGMRALAVLDSDLTVAPEGMSAFEDRPAGPLARAWIDEMVANAGLVAADLGSLVAAWEILPRPNAGTPPRIAPGRWAALVSEIAAAVRAGAPESTIVAGGLVSDDGDDGVDYLTAAYRSAAADGTWPMGAAPFDYLGIDLRVLADGGPSEDVVAVVVAERVSRLWRVVERLGGPSGAPRGVFVTGLAWDAARTGDDIQARNVWTALDTLTRDARVAMVVWSGLADANPYAEGAIGLYRGTGTTPEDRRWAWNAFNDFALYARQISPAVAEDLLVPTVPVPVAARDASGSPEPSGDGSPEPAAVAEPARRGAVDVTPVAEPEPALHGAGDVTPAEPETEPALHGAGDVAPTAEPEPEPDRTVEPEVEPAADLEARAAVEQASEVGAAVATQFEAAPPPDANQLAAKDMIAEGGPVAPPAREPAGLADTTDSGLESIAFRIPGAVEVLRAQGIDGARLDAALEAVRVKYGGHEWLPPGEYHVTIRRPGAAVPAGPSAPPPTNQQVISALYRAGGGTWALFERTGLKLSELAAQRTRPYTGPEMTSLEALTESERRAVALELEAMGGVGR